MNLHRHAADDSFCRYAFRNFLANYIQSRLTAAGQESLLPVEWIEGLRAPQTKAQEFALRLRAALVEAVGALRGAGVHCRVLKGLPFACKYYGHVDLRRMTDIDLLIRRADADRALTALWGLGYRCKPTRVKVTKSGMMVRNRMFRRRRHSLHMSRDGVCIDLHWYLRNEPNYRLDDNAVWADAQQVSIDGVTYDVLNDEYALVLLLLSIADDIGRGSCRLKYLVDVYQLMCNRHVDLDWPMFFEHRSAENILKITVNVLAIGLDVLDCGDDFPTLVREMKRHEKLRVTDDPDSSIRLVHGQDGSEANAIWLTQFHRVAGRRAWMWASISGTMRWGLGWIGGLRGGKSFTKIK